MKSFNDSLTGKYLRIALPAALEGIFMTFLAAADLIMVGVLGAKAIAAVSIFLPPGTADSIALTGISSYDSDSE